MSPKLILTRIATACKDQQGPHNSGVRVSSQVIYKYTWWDLVKLRAIHSCIIYILAIYKQNQQILTARRQGKLVAVVRYGSTGLQ